MLAVKMEQQLSKVSQALFPFASPKRQSKAIHLPSTG